MNLVSASRIAIKALLKNKGRSFLTILGIIIGVGSVIAMVSFGKSSEKSNMARLEAAGTNMLKVFAGARKIRGIKRFSSPVNTLTVEDGEAIEKECKYIKYVSPEVKSVCRVIYRGKNWATAISGGNSKYQYIRNWKLEKGRFFTPREVDNTSKVAVIGTIVRDKLFGNEDPIGKIVRIKRIPFKVIGVLESKGQSGWHGNMDDVVIIPYTTHLKKIFRRDYITTLVASAYSMDDSEKAKEEITEILRRRHHLRKGEDDDFFIMTQKDRMETARKMNVATTIYLSVVASVSLLVGGIGIMNIMLVSVTERTKEIGIRMALGAKKKDILAQFIIEAVILSVIGGIIGVLLGILASYIISRMAHWPWVISIPSIIIAVIFSGCVGVFFGFYPAWRASCLNPIDALRNE